MRIAILLLLANALGAAPSLPELIRNSASPPRMIPPLLQQGEKDNCLLLACELNRTEWIGYLLKNGANPNASRLTGAFGTVPLQIARNHRNQEVIRMLVGAGGSHYGWSPVHLGAILNQTNELQVLIAKGADLNGKDLSHWTPVDYAIHFRNTSAFVVLIAGGAKHSYLPLQLAVIVNHLENVAALSMDCKELNRRSGITDFTPLMLAVLFDRHEACKILIASGADLEAQAPDRGTSLMLAVENDSRSTLGELLRAGADPNHIMSGRYSPLTYAVWKDNLLIAKMLIEAGANPDLAPRRGSSARDFSEKGGSPEMQRLLKGN